MSSLEPKLVVFTGPMFSGKSTELYAAADRYAHAGRRIQAFKHGIDARYTQGGNISTHSHLLVNAMAIGAESGETESDKLVKLIEGDTEVVLIDEAQFFDPKIVEACVGLRGDGLVVYVACLDMDFQRNPFRFRDNDRNVGNLLAVADEVHKKAAVCKAKTGSLVCGRDARYSMRIAGGQNLVEVGGAEKYIATCLEHHKIPEEQQ